MIQRVSQGFWHRLSPGAKLLPVTRVTRAVALGNPGRAHGTPFVMITAEPQFSHGTKLVIFCNLARRQVTVIVEDRFGLGKRVVQIPCDVAPSLLIDAA